MKIHQKLFIGYLIITLVVGAIGYLGILTNRVAKEGYNEAAHHTIPVINALSNLRFAGLRIVSSTIEFSFLRTEKQVSDKDIEQADKDIEQADKDIERLINQEIALYNEALKQYEDLVNRFSPAHYEHLQSIRNLGLRIQETSKELINLKRQGKLESGFIEKKEAFEKDEKAFSDAVDFIILKEQKDFINKKKQLESSLEASTIIIILGALISAIAAILIGAFISRSISKPIIKLRDAAGEIGKGNLDTRTDIKSKNEIGQLADSFNKMAEDLKRYHNHLEELVEKHAAELRDANEHLKQEINERKRTEQAMWNSKERFRSLAAMAPLGIYVIDDDRRCQYVNKRWCEMAGMSYEEALGDGWIRGLHPDDSESIFDKLNRKWGFEHRFQTPEGKITWAFGVTNPMSDANGQSMGFVGIDLDITERKRLDEELEKHRNHLEEMVKERTAELTKANEELEAEISEQKQAEKETQKLGAKLQMAQKMEAIGTLSGGIAHNFNNLLMGIQGNISLMLIDIDSLHPYYKRLKTIEEQIQSGVKLSSQLLGYASKGKYEVKPINLNQIVNELSNTFGQTRKEIVIHQKLAEDLFVIEADQRQVEQVLLNLFVNAADAMPGGGDLILETMNVTHKDIKYKFYEPKAGNYIMLMVKDTGIGMDKSTIERIFDPFFTTKEMGRGTGLGLSSVYGIIKAHGGYIDVESREKQGTTFRVYLPASKSKILKATKTSDRVIKKTRTVLVVDDEEVVQVLCRGSLETIGYRVFTAKSGEEAIELYRKNQDEIDIVVLDMIMPNMSGGEVYDRMKELNADIKVLLSSSYSMEGEAAAILNRGCDGFIRKPFNINVLSAKIREILEKKK
ncbi:MAG: response regulator [Proteobacteria bacterium]|nr:response regulator [Pseudomonadota bacterium]